jgi:hypothetical protein
MGTNSEVDCVDPNDHSSTLVDSIKLANRGFKSKMAFHDGIHWNVTLLQAVFKRKINSIWYNERILKYLRTPIKDWLNSNVYLNHSNMQASIALQSAVRRTLCNIAHIRNLKLNFRDIQRNYVSGQQKHRVYPLELLERDTGTAGEVEEMSAYNKCRSWLLTTCDANAEEPSFSLIATPSGNHSSPVAQVDLDPLPPVATATAAARSRGSSIPHGAAASCCTSSTAPTASRGLGPASSHPPARSGTESNRPAAPPPADEDGGGEEWAAGEVALRAAAYAQLGRELHLCGLAEDAGEMLEHALAVLVAGAPAGCDGEELLEAYRGCLQVSAQPTIGDGAGRVAPSHETRREAALTPCECARREGRAIIGGYSQRGRVDSIGDNARRA